MMWNPFRLAAKQPAQPKASAGILYDEYAIEQVFAALVRISDPDLILQQAGIKRERLRMLETDDEVSGALETRREAVLSTDWRLEGQQGDPLEFVWAELDGVIDALLRGAWEAVPYGYSVVECVYALRDQGRVGVHYTMAKPLEWFEPRRDGALLYTPTDGGEVEAVDLTTKYLLTRRNPTYRNPYGEALLSRLYWPWFFRHNAWRFWMQFLERFGEPLLLGKVSSPKDFVEGMQKLGITAVAGVGMEESIEAVTQSARGEFKEAEAALTRRINKLILGHSGVSESTPGRLGGEDMASEVRNDKRRSDIRLLVPTAQRLVNALWRLNAFNGDPPEFVMEDGAGLEPERADRDAKLVQSGAVRLTEQYLLRTYDFEQGDFEIPVPAAPPAGLTRRMGAVELAQGGRFTADQQAVEDLADAALTEAGSPIPAELIREAILQSEDPEDLAERLARLAADADPVAMRAVLEQALFAADVMGYAHLTEDSA